MALSKQDLRNRFRLGSGLILFAFVATHLSAHITLLISIEFGNHVLSFFMYPWRTSFGTTILISAFVVHYCNALWSVYVRRSLKISSWELWQLALGLSIPILLVLHVSGTRIAEAALAINPDYASVLISQWVRSSWLNLLQIVAVVTVWVQVIAHPRNAAEKPRTRSICLSIGARLKRGFDRLDIAAPRSAIW